MSKLKGRITKIAMGLIGVLCLAYVFMPKAKIQEVTSFGAIPLPEGCAVIQKMPQALFIRCVVKGNWVYLATITSRGVTMGQPVKLL